MVGFNGTVFAYGQTSSGKTHSLMGNPSDPGITRRSCVGLFDKIRADANNQYLVRVSYMELYNEEIKDLIEPSDKKLNVIDDKKLGPYVKGLSDHVCIDPDGIDAMISKGEANRSYGYTDMNANSSRSHVIFKMIIESSPVKGGGGGGTAAKAWDPKKKASISMSSIHLVDLAGSERQGKTNATGARLQEGKAEESLFLTYLEILTVTASARD